VNLHNIGGDINLILPVVSLPEFPELGLWDGYGVHEINHIDEYLVRYHVRLRDAGLVLVVYRREDYTHLRRVQFYACFH